MSSNFRARQTLLRLRRVARALKPRRTLLCKAAHFVAVAGSRGGGFVELVARDLVEVRLLPRTAIGAFDGMMRAAPRRGRRELRRHRSSREPMRSIPGMPTRDRVGAFPQCKSPKVALSDMTFVPVDVRS